MTREEAHSILSNGLVNAPSEHEWCIAFEMAIKALEQEPCEDCVRRQEVIDVLKDKWGMFSDANDAMQESIDTIKALKPVTPQSETVTDFADRCRECGAKYGKLLKQDSCEGAISRQAMHIELEKWITYGEYKYSNATKYLYDRIDRLPPVTPQPKMGRWIIDAHRIRVLENGTEIHDYSVHCDKCHYGWDYTTDKEGSLVSNFCPNCGCAMEGGKNG